jgi:hypothetical protein
MVIIETPIFTRRIQAILSDEEYRLLQIQLINKPDSGKVIRGSGGLRKLRWSAGGHGKRGDEQDDLTPEQLRQLKKVVEGEYR